MSMAHGCKLNSEEQGEIQNWVAQIMKKRMVGKGMDQYSI